MMADYEDRFDGNGESTELFGDGSSPLPRSGHGGFDDYTDSKYQRGLHDHERESSKSRESEREKGCDRERGRDREREREIATAITETVIGNEVREGNTGEVEMTTTTMIITGGGIMRGEGSMTGTKKTGTDAGIGLGRLFQKEDLSISLAHAQKGSKRISGFDMAPPAAALIRGSVVPTFLLK